MPGNPTNRFHIIITGSNGYSKIPVAPGGTTIQFLNDSYIVPTEENNYLVDSQGVSTYLGGVDIGVYDLNICIEGKLESTNQMDCVNMYAT